MTNARSSNVWTRYTYDGLGQLKTAAGYDNNSAPRDHEDFRYSYDAAGNLTNRIQNRLTNNFTINDLNQLSGGSRSGTLTVAGTLSSPATSVTVNSLTATRFQDNTFSRTNLSLMDGTNTFTAIAQDSLGRTDSNSISVYLPAAPAFAYDSNGNLTYDGVKSFEYDDENQLVRLTATNQWKSEFTYDGKMRRRIRREFTWQNNTWVLTNDVRYIYDGNLEIQWRDAQNVPRLTLTRGRDLSGTLGDAGGIGGLLARTDSSSLAASHSYFHSDGNGNVVALIDTFQEVVARYAYEPFGRMFAISGRLAEANVYRSSSKEFHPPSGLVAYTYRYYGPSLQRWINRDPIEEEGGLNLYLIVGNHPFTGIDPFGLAEVTKVGDKKFTIEVGKCEIVRHIGHGNPKGWPRFFFPKKKLAGCPAAAGFIGCYATDINQGIPRKGGFLIPGSPTDSAGGIWDGQVDPYRNTPDWTKAMEDTDAGIKSLVNDWLKNKSQCCPAVTVTDVDENGKQSSKTHTKPIP